MSATTLELFSEAVDVLPSKIRLRTPGEATDLLARLRDLGATRGDLAAVRERVTASRRQGCHRYVEVMGCLVDVWMPVEVGR